AALAGEDEARMLALLPGAAMALWVAGRVEDPRDGATVALHAIETGRALETLEDYIAFTRQGA
ncbi:MAG: hypothetical protein NZL85_02040, partial [Fimbriimonadales bacterium]|nr:hypothetical protein [Fimbriimonadales bacterium]